MNRLSGDQKADAQLIGQFGVGFYSGFIVADRIVVESRRAGLQPEEGVRWTSAGAGDFEVESITGAQRGTSVTLHLREEDAAEYLSTWKLKAIIAKYSDHISLPILMRKEEWKEGEDNKGGQMVLTDEWETVNQASALVGRPKKDITPEQYQEFYKQISHDPEAPLAWSHNRVEEFDRIHPAAVHPVARAIRPVEPREGRGREALCEARVHHGRGARRCCPRTCASSRA